MLGWIITAVIAIPFIILAIFLYKGKGAFLIAGYNTMSDEKRAAYDEKALSKAVGTLLLVLSALMFLFPLAMQLEAMWLFWVSFALFMIITIVFAIYANTGNRFRRNTVSADTQITATGQTPMSKGVKFAIVFCVIFTILIFIGVGIMFYYGEKDPVITIQNDSIKIDAMYGLTINKSELQEVNLIEKNMHDIGIGRRTNGYGGFGQALKGNFSSAELGNHLLFVYADSSPTIQLRRTGGSDIFISFRDGETTRNIYHQISG